MTRHDRPYRPLSILVVDDLEDAAQCEAALLALMGYKVQVALSGAAALQSVAAEWPDVVLLDIRMPGMDGFVAARTIREWCAEGEKQPLIVAVTGCASEAARRQSAEAGFDLYLLKPVEPAALADVLERFARLQETPISADEFESPHEDYADSRLCLVSSGI